LKRRLRVSRYTLACACAAFLAGCAANARITDVSGHVYDVKSLRPASGGFRIPYLIEPKLDIYCDGVRIRQPLSTVKNIKISQAEISPVDGKPHFGVEALLRDGAVIGGGGAADGGDGAGKCFISADNGFAGTSAKGAITAPFEKIASVYILGKEDKEGKKPKKGKEGPAPEGDRQGGGSGGTPQAEGNDERQRPEKE
jgi:hypothetical protein